MEASETISMRSFGVLLLLIIFGGLPFASGRQIMTPEDSRMTSNSSTYSTLGHLGKQVIKTKMNYRMFITGKEDIDSAKNVGSTPSSLPAAVAGSQETTGSASTSTKSNKDSMVKNWGPWVLLILLVSTGISVHCYCYRGFPQTSEALSVSPSISVTLTTAPICCCCKISS